MTDRYAVIGNPIGHSKSPAIHRSFAEQSGQALEYGAIEGPLGGFAAAVDAFRASGGRGLNITAPFKLDAFAYATELRPDARLAGAVNAMKFEGGQVVGENFDGVGLARDIAHNLGCGIAGKRVLVLGAGGAARGAVLPLLQAGPAALAVVNRTVTKAGELVRAFAQHGRLHAYGYADLPGLGGFDLVINATSASLLGELPPIGPASFAPGCLAYDMTYGKGLTPFLHVARDGGALHLADGVGMLVEQAAEAFAWWRGVRPATAPVIAAIAVPLAPRAPQVY